MRRLHHYPFQHHFIHYLFNHSIKNADISLCVLPLPEILSPASSVSSSQKTEIIIPPDIKDLVTPTTYFLFNKSDLVSPSQRQLFQQGLLAHPHEEDTLANLKGRSWTASLVTSEGSHEFVQGLAESLKSRYGVSFLSACTAAHYLAALFRFDIHDPNSAAQGSQSQNKLHGPLITRARHRVHLESACKFLEAFLALREFYLFFSNSFPIVLQFPIAAAEDVVLAAEELRYAAQAVGRVTGDIGVEDVLDAVFKDFCIGK